MKNSVGSKFSRGLSRLGLSLALLATVAGRASLAAEPVLPLDQSASRGITTRDPSSIIRCKDQYWIFYTGKGVGSYHSKDLVTWEAGPRVFETAPPWAAAAVPQNTRMIYWAPDIIHQGDRYDLYYTISSPGSMTSAIGLATNPTLDPADPAFHWTDRGIVIQSHAGDPIHGGVNTLDPAIFRDEDRSLWLSFGSYFGGIKLMQLDPRTGLRTSENAPIYPIAHHSSIEASLLYKRDGYYYLFVNWGSCGQGAKSTYQIMVGRSKTITGPYLDREGKDLQHSGGTLFFANQNGPLTGPGHPEIMTIDGRDWLSCHFESDARRGDATTFAIMPMHWDAEGWPHPDLPDK